MALHHRRFFAPLRLTAPLVASLAAASCGADADTAIQVRGEAMSYVLAEQVEGRIGTVVNLADLAPFRWDRLYVFGPGTPVATVRDSVGSSWPGLSHFGAATPDTVNLLIFVGDGRVLAAAAHPRRHGDVAPARVGRGYTPAQALFRVDSTDAGFGRRVLR